MSFFAHIPHPFINMYDFIISLSRLQLCINNLYNFPCFLSFFRHVLYVHLFFVVLDQCLGAEISAAFCLKEFVVGKHLA